MRSQSKEIAENVRTKVRGEKKRRISEFEKKSEHKLKEWQARKLLELHNQYQENLRDIGLGHRQADEIRSAEEQMEIRKTNEAEIARARGRKAVEKQKADDKENQKKRSLQKQRRQTTRDVENVRSAMVSCFEKKCSNRCNSGNEDQLNVSDENSVVTSDGSEQKDDQVPTVPSSSTEPLEISPPVNIALESERTVGGVQTATIDRKNSPEKEKIATTQYPVETRISDRIRHRSIRSAVPDDCDTLSQETAVNTARQIIISDTQVTKPAFVQRRDVPTQVTPAKDRQTTMEIPHKPILSLKQFENQNWSKSNVERINEDEFQIVMNNDEEDRTRKMQRRDREAEQRGRQAFQREKTRKDYDELMGKLPLLQKQERLGRIFTEKPETHMSSSRLKEVEERKQLLMENTFERTFHNLKPNTITVKPRTEPDISATAKKVEECRCEDIQGETNRERQLKELLKNLQAQKEMLLKEVDALPEESRLGEILGGLRDVDGKTKIKKSQRSQKEKRKRSGKTGSNSSSPSSPRKKPKFKGQQVLVLQNTSTQTTPVVKTDALVGGSGVESAEKATSPLESHQIEIQKPVNICKSTGDPCGCKDDKLCEIVIKIHEKEKEPDIVVKSSKKFDKEIDVAPNKVITVADNQGAGARNTWHERFFRNHSTLTSSSTSYYSPPTILEAKVAKKTSKSHKDVGEKSKQSNSSQTRKTLHPFVAKYVEKLLSMSRVTIDDLSVSSVSEVTTPSSSMIETSTNDPLERLRRLLRHFGVTVEELREVKSTSEKHENTIESSKDRSTMTSRSTKVSEDDDRRYSEKMRKYAEIAESCNKRISDLTAMIEKVRSEKKKMMDSSNNTTSYLDPPATADVGVDSSAEQEELNRKMLTIDRNLTEEELKDRYESIVAITETSDDDEDMRKRFRHLVTVEADQPTESFVPMLSDIPKFPKLTTESVKTGKRPPLSKGLTTVKRFNDNIDTVPHELSTIVEADTKLSEASELQQIEKVQKKLSSNDDSSTSDEVRSLERMLTEMGMGWAIATLRKTQEALALTSSSSSVDINIRSSASEISLREVLSRRFLAKTTTSSSSTEEGSSAISMLLLREFQDVSAIVGSGSAGNEGRRTSTPIQTAPVTKETNSFSCKCGSTSATATSGSGKKSD